MIIKKSYKEITEMLVDAELKVTPQRVKIFEVLQSTDNHPTAEEIFKEIAEQVPGLSLATVYKTLDTFIQKGIIRKIKGEDDSVHFDADINSHNHLICSKTKKIIDYNDPDLQGILDAYFSKKSIDGFSIKEIQLNIIGETN